MKMKKLTQRPLSYIIAAECDVLCDEDAHYAEALKKAGNKVHFEIADGFIHGFLNQVYIPTCYDAMMKFFGSLRAHLWVL
jgi:acetyl esterase/lipase